MIERKRRDFSKIGTTLQILDLIEVQKTSYERFLQRETSPSRREDSGLQAAFASVFPIANYNDTAIIEFLEYSLSAPKYDVRECRERGMTYATPLKIRVRLVVKDKDEKTGVRRVRDMREQEVYLGELPLMTEHGTFVINGTDRIVVSQLHRSPGVSFSHDKGKVHASGKVLYASRVFPARGSWLDFEFDTKDILHVRIDRRRKMPVTILLKAFGYSTDDIIRLYYPVEKIFTDGKGRFLKSLQPAIHTGTKAPTDIRSRKTRRLLASKGTILTTKIIAQLKAEGVTALPIAPEDLRGAVVLHEGPHPKSRPESRTVLDPKSIVPADDLLAALARIKAKPSEVLLREHVQARPIIWETLAAEKVVSTDEAMVEIYKRLKPGESPTVETSKTLFRSLFSDPKRYDLSPVGRLKLNKRLYTRCPLDEAKCSWQAPMEQQDDWIQCPLRRESCPVMQRTLTQKDTVEVVRQLLLVKMGKREVDDIDHLGNRRIRSAGELLENQFRIGLVRMERMVKERMNLLDLETAMPHDLINAKPVAAAIKEFFGSSQLSQFMDQTNPLAEITHKRRLSALGPGGLTRERAGFEVRDVHPSHYGRICPIETPEGPNIGLITSLATYARVNTFGFIEAPYRRVKHGAIVRSKSGHEEIVYLSAIDGDRAVIAQANTPVDSRGRIVAEAVQARSGEDFVAVPPDRVDYMDVSPKQTVSVAAALIPFLEHSDANRALMGANMQRQAVPLIRTEAPIVGTGMEATVARDSGYVLLAKRSGSVERMDATRIVVRAEGHRSQKKGRRSKAEDLDIYSLVKFQRSNQNTCITQRPVVNPGQRVKAGQVLADGPATAMGELALGKDALVAFMPWGGCNFEDAILVSEALVEEDHFTSIHIEEFEVEAREHPKLGAEEMTRDIPNLGEEALRNLDEGGIIRIGAEVRHGDILVGKVTPKGETQLTPEEKLLRAIFGEKAADWKDTSLYVPPGIEGVVVDVKIFSRKGSEKNGKLKGAEGDDLGRLQRDHQEELRFIDEEKIRKIRRLLVDRVVARDLIDPESGEVLLKRKRKITHEVLARIPNEALRGIILSDPDEQEKLAEIERSAKEQAELLQTIYDEKVGRLRRGDELPPGVIKLVKVYIAMKRKLSVGDKMAGRHGNKGVVARVLPREDMPYLPDGTQVDVVLNPLGVPSRMNVGQILEAHLAWAAKALGLSCLSPVFEGAAEREIKDLLKEAGLPTSGQITLYDGRSGEPFDRPVTVGHMYMMKLHHLVDDKIHARSIGPYSLVTQQPLGGKAQFGGQRLGEMEVWALQAYGAASTLQEFLTVKSDDVPGRSRMYEAIVKGEPFLEPGLPESFNVLIKELQSLGLDVELLKTREG